MTKCNRYFLYIVCLVSFVSVNILAQGGVSLLCSVFVVNILYLCRLIVLIILAASYCYVNATFTYSVIPHYNTLTYQVNHYLSMLYLESFLYKYIIILTDDLIICNKEYKEYIK